MSDSQVQTQDTTVSATQMVTELKSLPLTATEQADVEKTFAEAKDFRSLGEKITAPIDSIISETAAIIDHDPLL